jgi:hypothetical protein
MGPSGLLPIRRKVYCGFLSPVEIHRLSRVRTRNLWGPVASTLTTTPPRRHYTRTPSISLDSSVIGRYGRAIAQAVSRGFSSRRLRFAPRSVHRICGEQSGSRIGFPLSSFVFHVGLFIAVLLLHILSCILWEINIEPVNGSIPQT